MKSTLALAALVLALLPVLAADPAKPNALTPKEIADGWLQLFDGETTFGWKIEGEAKVENGTMVLGGEKLTTATLNTPFGDYLLKLEYSGENLGKVRWMPVSNSDTGYMASTQPVAKSQWIQAAYEIKDKVVDIALKNPADNKTTHATGSYKNVGPNWVKFSVPAGTRITLRDIKLLPIGLKSIFSGKDLTGWKEHAGKKSKFAIADGAINIKDGPGDLQSEGQWADFVLQLDCISNGKHLNSGLFFRCIPGDYQNGYEAQVHNGFLPEAKEYTIDVHDPQTGKLIDKQKVKSAAIDFGTGAIYRRVPARKLASKDGEWLTMTVVATGRHIATWVNGVQMVDWTDHRAPNANPRNGYRAEKGPISLQGHDPTTDLSFKNFRIAELPAAPEKK